MLIKTRAFSPNKVEKTYDHAGGLGWAPGYEKKFEGVEQRDNTRYEKNFALLKGICEKCGFFIKDATGTKGEHCKGKKCLK